MNFTALEIQLCEAWAREHSEEDDPLSVMRWKLLEIGKEKAERSAAYHARQVAEVGVDMDQLSAEFYKAEAGEGDGDPEVDF